MQDVYDEEWGFLLSKTSSFYHITIKRSSPHTVPVDVFAYINSLSAFQVAFDDVHVAIEGGYHDVQALGLWTRILGIFLVL
jgi:hypothetical protein